MGVLSGILDQEAFMIDSLFVDPEKRRHGAGRALIESLDSIFPEGDTLVREEFNIENENNESLPGFLRHIRKAPAKRRNSENHDLHFQDPTALSGNNLNTD